MTSPGSTSHFQWEPFRVTPEPKAVSHKEELRQCSEATPLAVGHRLKMQPHAAAGGSPRSFHKAPPQKKYFRLGMVAKTFDPYTEEAEAGGSL